MLYRLFFALALVFLCGLTAFAAGDYRGPQQLGGSMVAWTDNRLTVEIENAPVKGVLEDLIESQGFACEVMGDLQGAISMVIDNLTVEEAILKILRNSQYDYTMVISEIESSDGNHAAVIQLTIYQGNDIVRFVRNEKPESSIKPKRDESKIKTLEKPPVKKPVTINQATGEELEKLDQEIKLFMDEMLSEEKIGKIEYDDAVRALGE